VALTADAHHLMTDVWTSAAVLVAVIGIALTGWQRLDPILGLALCFHIVFTGVRLIRESMHGLMDTGLPPDEIETIRTVLQRHESSGVQHHALRTRQAGARRFMSVHLLVPGEMTVHTAHDLAETIEQEIRAAVPRLTVFTHIEPVEDPVSWQDQELDRT
jgi:cation diffusion facilitator family transporter